MASTNVLAYDSYTLENYAYFDPITSNKCDETNYWTIYNPGSTCYRFLVLDTEDTSSNESIKLLLDHDLGSGTYSEASSILTSGTANWARFNGTKSLPDENTIATLMKLGSNRPEIVDGVSTAIAGDTIAYELGVNTKYVINGVTTNTYGYWLSGNPSATDYAYSVNEKRQNTLVLKTETRGVRPMITISKSLLTHSTNHTNLTSALQNASEFKYPAITETFDGYTYKALQGFTFTNSMLVFAVSNSSNATKGLMVSYKGNNYGTLNRIDYKEIGHSNGMTFNSATNTVLATGRDGAKKIVEFDADSLEEVGEYSVPVTSSIGYDANHNYYMISSGRRLYVTNNNFEELYSFDLSNYFTGQDLEYHNGYVYYICDDAGPSSNQLYGYKGGTSRVYAYNAKFKRDGTPEKDFGRLEKVFYIDVINRDGLGSTGELEGIGFTGGFAWFGYYAGRYDSTNHFKFYRMDFTNIMVPPSYKVSYNEGNSYTTVTISSDTQLHSLAGWTLSSDKYSLSKAFNDRKAAFNVNLNDNYGNSVAVPITELTTQKTDLAFPEAAINREYKIGSFSYPATTESNGTITYSSSNENVAIVDNTGKVTIRGMGMARITATITKGDGYYQGEASYTLNVTKSLQELSFSQTTVQKTYKDADFTITATHTLGDGEVTYSSSNEMVAVVTNAGKVTIRGAGNAVITATAAGTDGFEETSASYTLNVAKKSQTIAFSQSSISKYTGASPFTVTATLSDGDGTITYSSSNTNVATVDNNGVVTVVGAGDTIITAIASETSNYLSSSASYGLSVYQKNAQTITFDATSVDKNYKDADFTFSAHHTLGDGTVTYSSSNPNVATVDNNGKVKILNAGYTIITAEASETEAYARTTASYTLNVNKIEQTIAFDESTINKKYTDKSYTMTATLTKGDGTISYRSTDEGVATVDNSGKVTIRGVGTTTIIATAGVTDNYLSTTTSYSLNVTKGEQVLTNESENNDPITVFDTVQSFHLDVQHEVGDGNLSYSSSNEEVATIDEEALVTIVAPGTTTLTVVAEETDLYLRQVYSRVLEVESTPSPITSTTGEVVNVENTGIMRHFPIISIGLILLGIYYLYRQEFIFVKNKKSSRN